MNSASGRRYHSLTNSHLSHLSLPARDLRLDFFRGLALVCIFIDHVPGNLLANYTIRNLGISDASEVFVFVSAYTAGLIHMGRIGREGFMLAALRVLRRAWQLYVG